MMNTSYERILPVEIDPRRMNGATQVTQREHCSSGAVTVPLYSYQDSSTSPGPIQL